MSTFPAPAPRDLSRTLPVGREPEYRRLREAFDRCAAGAGSVIVLHGSVGSGRSDLLYAFTDTAAERGAHVLVGTGSPLEREFPLGLARQLLQGADLEPEEAAAAETLLADGAAEGSRPTPSDGPQGRLTQRTLEGLFRLVRRLAERAPVLIAVDDRQDADPQSLEFLLYLVRRTRSAGVLTVLSSRETMTPSNPFFEVELARQPHHQHIRLDLLSTELVAELLRTRLGAASVRLAAEAHALTGGNPLLVHSLIGDQESAGVPDELVVGEGYRRGLMHCLHRIDPLALHYARGVAVLGPSATPELLAELLLLAPDSLPRALYLLHAAGLFRDGGFRHPTAAGDLLAAMRPVELAALHQRAGRLLRAAGAADATVHGHARVAEGHLRSSLSAGESVVPRQGAGPGSGPGADPAAGAGAGTYGWPPGLDGSGGSHASGGPGGSGGSGGSRVDGALGGAGSTGGFGAAVSAVGSMAGSALGSAAGFGGAWAVPEPGPVAGTAAGLRDGFSDGLAGWLTGGSLSEPSEAPTGGPGGPAGWPGGPASTGGFGPEAGHGPAVGVLGSFGTAAVECVPTLPGTVTDADAALRHELKTVRHHFWHGRTEQGVAALTRFEAAPGNAASAEALRYWLAYWYPGLLPNPARPQPARSGAAADHRGDGMRLLAGLLAGTVTPEAAVVQAELVLRAGRLGGVRTESLTAALTVLLYADRADRAAHWCGPLAARAGVRCGANWHALLAALRAETALRQGDLRGADEAGRAAFAHVRPEAWGSRPVCRWPPWPPPGRRRACTRTPPTSWSCPPRRGWPAHPRGCTTGTRWPATGSPSAGPRRRSPTTAPAVTRWPAGAWTTCPRSRPGGSVRPAPTSPSAAVPPRPPWPTSSSPGSVRPGTPGSAAWRCGSGRRRASGPSGRSCWNGPSPCWRRPAQRPSSRPRSPSSARPTRATATPAAPGRPTAGSGAARRWRSCPPRARPRSRPPAGSPRPSGGSPNWPPGACPTGTSPASCTSPSPPSSSTSRGSTASWAFGAGSTSPSWSARARGPPRPRRGTSRCSRAGGGRPPSSRAEARRGGSPRPPLPVRSAAGRGARWPAAAGPARGEGGEGGGCAGGRLRGPAPSSGRRGPVPTGTDQYGPVRTGADRGPTGQGWSGCERSGNRWPGARGRGRSGGRPQGRGAADGPSDQLV